MLPDRLSRLITGLVDGQLSAAEQKQALGLVRRSADARELLKRLQQDAQLVAALPRAQLPAEFNEHLLASLPKRALKAAEFSSKKHDRRFNLQHAGVYAAAATLLLALGIAYVQQSKPARETGDVAVTPGEPPVGTASTRTNVAELLPSPRPDAVIPVNLTPLPPGTATPGSELLANMPRPEPDVLGAPLANNEPLRIPDPKVPLILAMSQIDQPRGRGRIAEELARGSVWRLDLNCQESEVATTRLKRALQEQGIHLLVDPDAADRQKLHFARTTYAVLVENVSQAECLGMLGGLRKVDRDEQARSRRGNQFLDLKLASLSTEDAGHFEQLFGFKAVIRDVTKSVPAEVNSRDAGVMAAARAAAVWRGQNPEGQGAARIAFLVADIVGRVRKPSNENQLFLNSRQPQRPDSLQLMIVLTPRKG